MPKQVSERLTPVSTVSIGALKVLQEFGLNTVQGAAFSENLLKIMTEEDKVRRLGLAVFGESFASVSLEALDLKAFREGVTRFLSELMNGSAS